MECRLDSMCTSSMMYTLYLPTCGGMRTLSINFGISSTERRKDGHPVHGWNTIRLRQTKDKIHMSRKLPGFPLLQAIDSLCKKIRAQVVFHFGRKTDRHDSCFGDCIFRLIQYYPDQQCRITKLLRRYFLCRYHKLIQQGFKDKKLSDGILRDGDKLTESIHLSINFHPKKCAVLTTTSPVSYCALITMAGTRFEPAGRQV